MSSKFNRKPRILPDLRAHRHGRGGSWDHLRPVRAMRLWREAIAKKAEKP